MTRNDLSTREKKILDTIEKRVIQGRCEYGEYPADKKNIKEAIEECLDLSVYLAAELVKLEEG
jgi:hypothetical protein